MQAAESADEDAWLEKVRHNILKTEEPCENPDTAEIDAALKQITASAESLVVL